MKKSTKPTFALIINFASGSEKDNEQCKKIQQMFRKKNVHVDIIKVEEPGLLNQTIEKTIAKNYSTIIAAGGDGTISAVASKLMNTKITLGVLPLGTMNNFAKTLEIPQELEEAITTIISHQTTQVDVASVNEKYFINNSNIGVYPYLVKHREHEQEKGKPKWLAVIFAFLRIIFHYPLLELTFKIKDEKIIRKTPIVFIGNNKYHLTPQNLGKRKNLHRHILSIFITKTADRKSFFFLILKIIFGQLEDETLMETFLLKEIVINNKKPTLLVSIDGEQMPMKTPLKYQIHANALTVIIPNPT
jgi:YegS/Rv2252/BmrU family lipid kinase